MKKGIHTCNVCFSRCADEFQWASLIWIYCNPYLNKKIDWLHERYLQIVYANKISSFSEQLEKDGFLSIHCQNTRQFASKMLEVSKGLCPETMKWLFDFRNKVR